MQRVNARHGTMQRNLYLLLHRHKWVEIHKP
ncbi:BnaA05g37420D [Brassica napus]|uniref:BnaA05g37420D protein n=1 Tax=Brassica napus TaxID=3708 RepID=A0A078ILK6_BRANA|nr:BnaA05g37420D [Brassica napus]